MRLRAPGMPQDFTRRRDDFPELAPGGGGERPETVAAGREIVRGWWGWRRIHAQTGRTPGGVRPVGSCGAKRADAGASAPETGRALVRVLLSPGRGAGPSDGLRRRRLPSRIRGRVRRPAGRRSDRSPAGRGCDRMPRGGPSAPGALRRPRRCRCCGCRGCRERARCSRHRGRHGRGRAARRTSARCRRTTRTRRNGCRPARRTRNVRRSDRPRSVRLLSDRPASDRLRSVRPVNDRPASVRPGTGAAAAAARCAAPA